MRGFKRMALIGAGRHKDVDTTAGGRAVCGSSFSFEIAVFLFCVLTFCCCGDATENLSASENARADVSAKVAAVEDERYKSLRERMVHRDIRRRGIVDPRVLTAMQAVPRHEFVPASYRESAYEDRPLPIGYDQTISQPYIVALMTELLELDGTETVLEIGTGSGYQAAVLAESCTKVVSIEIVEPLAKRSKRTLQRLGYDNVEVRAGDGYAGWPEKAPFQAIILTAAPKEIPQPLLDQLAVGGVLVAPVGAYDQWLVKVRRTEEGLKWQRDIPVRFVPMTGKARHRE